VGLVRGDHHQGVLEHALAFQVVEEAAQGIVEVGDGGLLGGVVALQVVLGRRVGLVGADGEQGEHPGLALLQLADIAQGALEEGAVVLAPGELQVVVVAEPSRPCTESKPMCGMIRSLAMKRSPPCR
jgi:hypothetical protein